ncbi:MAG TPA: alpha-ribazole phosphatase family protein, partial [Gammaproteobacteria bacterium]
MAATPTTVDLIRHGQPLGGSRFRGRLDDPLSDAGWQDMRRALGQGTRWTAVVSSPLLRCADFARDHARRLGVPLELEPRFAELGFGDWEGCQHADLRASDGERLRAFWADPEHNPPPGGEPLLQFRDRVQAAWADLLAEHAGGHVLVVAHAGVIRILVMQVLGMPLERYYRL